MLSSHKLCPRLWSSWVGFIAPPAHPYCRPTVTILPHYDFVSRRARSLEDVLLVQRAFDDFISASIENGFDHEQAKALDLVEHNSRRHGESLPTDYCFTRAGPS